MVPVSHNHATHLRAASSTAPGPLPARPRILSSHLTGHLIRACLAIWACLVVLILGTGCRNFHEISPGRFYRSGQLTTRQLEHAIDKYGIRTVINLRGPDPDERWYIDQVRSCQLRGVAHHDVRMSARRVPHKDELCALLRVYEQAEPPLLVHCRGGSDRTGLAAALWVFEEQGRPKHKARKQLSERYLHFRKFSPSQRYFLKHYQGAIWAREVYDPEALGFLHYRPRRVAALTTGPE